MKIDISRDMLPIVCPMYKVLYPRLHTISIAKVLCPGLNLNDQSQNIMLRVSVMSRANMSRAKALCLSLSIMSTSKT